MQVFAGGAEDLAQHGVQGVLVVGGHGVVAVELFAREHEATQELGAGGLVYLAGEHFGPLGVEEAGFFGGHGGGVGVFEMWFMLCM